MLHAIDVAQFTANPPSAVWCDGGNGVSGFRDAAIILRRISLLAKRCSRALRPFTERPLVLDFTSRRLAHRAFALVLGGGAGPDHRTLPEPARVPRGAHPTARRGDVGHPQRTPPCRHRQQAGRELRSGPAAGPGHPRCTAWSATSMHWAPSPARRRCSACWAPSSA